MILLTQETPFQHPWGLHLDGGMHSLGLLLFLKDKNIFPDWTIFTATGAESQKLMDFIQGFPGINFISPKEDIYSWHWANKKLPSCGEGLVHCCWTWKICPAREWRDQNNLPHRMAYGHALEDLSFLKQHAAYGHNCNDPEQGEMWFPLAAWGISRVTIRERVTQEKWHIYDGKCQICPWYSEANPLISNLEQLVGKKGKRQKLWRVCDQDGVGQHAPENQDQENREKKPQGCHSTKRIPRR